MALALNVFKTVTANLTTTMTTIYTAPVSYTGIILMAQVSNITSTSGTITVAYNNGTDVELVKDFKIAGGDSDSVLSGKMVVETGKSIRVQGNLDNKFKIILSILETANE